MTENNYSSNRPVGGGALRFVFAAIILLGGAYTYYCSTQTNPIT